MRGWQLVLLVGILASCHAPDRAPARGPDVIVYLVDTLRPDHLGVYGYRRKTSPNVDAFAKDGVVFTNAYTPSSWTKPACASLLAAEGRSPRSMLRPAPR